MEVKPIYRPFGKAAIGLLLSIAGLLGLFAFQGSPQSTGLEAVQGELLFTCSMEQNEMVRGDNWFSQPGFEIHGGGTRWNGVARTGSHSSRVDQETRFGANLRLPVHGGEHYLARIWRKNISGMGALVAHLNAGLYLQQNNAVHADAEGWECLQITVHVPPSVESDTLSIYALYPGNWNGKTYFDDLAVWKLPPSTPTDCGPLQSDSLISTPLAGVQIRPFVQSRTAIAVSVGVLHFFEDSVEVIGGSMTLDGPIQKLNQPMIIGPVLDSVPQKIAEVQLAAGVQYLCYRFTNKPYIFREALIDRPSPQPTSPVQALLRTAFPSESPYYGVVGKEIRFKPGFHRITTKLVFPSGYRIFIPAGSKWDMVNGSLFLSFSPVDISGSSEHPVQIFSSDASAKGFSVLSEGRCIWSHAHFDRLRNLSHEGWELTSAVTVHGCDVEWDHISITHNHSEDALNLVHCRFNIKALEIGWTFADGFDADFCAGKIAESRFHDTGNDGMDFSGSQIEVADCKVESAGDKGISVGEKAHVVIPKGLVVTGAQIGVASKDHSEVDIYGAILENCKVGFAAYQKKPEFGPGYIRANKITMLRNERNYQLGWGSKLVLDGISIE